MATDGPVTGSGVEAAADWGNLKSPEIYLGHDRTANFSSPGGAALGRRRVYTAPARLALNQWALSGEWTMAKISQIGRDTLTMERDFNKAAGFKAEDNKLPEYFYTEVAPATGAVFDMSAADMVDTFK